MTNGQSGVGAEAGRPGFSPAVFWNPAEATGKCGRQSLTFNQDTAEIVALGSGLS